MSVFVDTGVCFAQHDEYASRHEAATDAMRVVLSGRCGRPYTSDLFDDSVATFERYRDHSLSFTDAKSVALVERYDIDAVLSFDDDFDGIVERIDPASI